MKLEHWFVVVIGLVIFAYVLDSVVNPLTMDLPTPYHFLTPDTFMLYPFTTVSMLVKAIALVIAPIITLALFGMKKHTKAIILFVVSALYQLYALQDVATNAGAIPVEWSISLSMAGIILIFTSLVYLFLGMGDKVNKLGIPNDSSDSSHSSSSGSEFKL